MRAAQELLAREKVELLFGGFLSNTGLALTDFAKQQQVFFLAAEPLTDKITWQEGNRYTYRLRPSTWMHVAALAQGAGPAQALGHRLPNYEYGQSAVATFKAMMKSFQSDVEFVAEQAVPLGKVDAGAVVQALADAKPDAIFNVLFAADLTRFVREGTRAACSRTCRWCRCCPASPNTWNRWAPTRPRDGSSPATPGMPSTRPRTRTS